MDKKKIIYLTAFFFCCILFTVSFTKVFAAETWLWPVAGSNGSDLSRGYDPSIKHYGIDICYPGIEGHDIRAAKSGTVVQSSNECPHYNQYAKTGDEDYRHYCNGGCGNYVTIDHGDGTKSRYLHMQQGSAIATGTVVKRGDVIGKVGSSGQSSGPHCHFDIFVNGSRINNNPGNIEYDFSSIIDPYPFRSYLATPQEGGNYSGEVKIEGYALLKDGVDHITAWVNGNAMACSTYNSPSVAQAYPGYPTGKEGFIATIPSNYLQDGENEISIYAYDAVATPYHIAKWKFNYTKLPFRSYLATPQKGGDYSGEVKIEGYALLGDGVDHITAWVNGNAMDCPTYNSPSVAQAYPGYPTGKEGFFATIPANYLQDGENEISVYAYDAVATPYHIAKWKFNYTKLPFRSYLATPQKGGNYSGEVKIEGYALLNDGVDHITAWVNGNAMDCPTYNSPSVAQAYPGYPTGKEGFFATIPANYLQDGENIISIYAYDAVATPFHIAKWTFYYTSPVTRTITYHLDGGINAAENPTEYIGNTTVTLSDPTKEHYTFKGWYRSETGDDKFQNGGTYDENLNLYARWEQNKVHIMFDGNEIFTSSMSEYARDKTPGEAYGTLPAITVEGYDFDGWFTEAVGGEQVTATSIVSATTDHTLYAHWTAKEFNMYFDINLDGMTAPASRKIRYNETYGDLPECEAEGYTFGGWFDSAEGSRKITGDTVFKGLEDVTLYAKWEMDEIPHTHSYESVVTTEPTCTEPGIRTFTCECGDSFTEDIPATGHAPAAERTDVKAATCTEAGYTGDILCTVCGNLISEGSVIPAIGHQHTEVRNARVATCSVEGYTGDTYCTDCETIVTSGNVIPKKEHEWNQGTVTKAATATEDGVMTYTCSACGETKEEAIPATGETKPTEPTDTPTPAVTGFSDVQDPTHPYYKAIYWAAEKEITKGYSDGTFGINRSCTRGEMMMFLWKYAGNPVPKYTSKSPFKDVSNSHAFYKAILWGYQKGITKGYSDGSFGIDRNVSRGEAMMFLWKLKGRPAPQTAPKSPFKDVPTTHAFYKAILWGSQNGITKGYTTGSNKGKFGINDNCTRGQIVTFLYKAR